MELPYMLCFVSVVIIMITATAWVLGCHVCSARAGDGGMDLDVHDSCTAQA